jgi:hypothetical protein
VKITQVRAEELSAGMPGRTTCQGDSGGPWLGTVGGKTVIMGLTSYGPAGCTDAASATRVDRVLDFIDQFLDGAEPPPVNGAPLPDNGSPGPDFDPDPTPPPPPPPPPNSTGGQRSASGTNCCVNGQYFQCPDEAACFGGFDINECLSTCSGPFDPCFDECFNGMNTAGPPKGCRSDVAPPPNVQCN